MTMVERVARMLADVPADPNGRWLKVAARAVIAAMREPTEAMIVTAINDPDQAYSDIWRAMIDAALEEKE